MFGDNIALYIGRAIMWGVALAIVAFGLYSLAKKVDHVQWPVCVWEPCRAVTSALKPAAAKAPIPVTIAPATGWMPLTRTGATHPTCKNGVFYSTPPHTLCINVNTDVMNMVRAGYRLEWRKTQPGTVVVRGWSGTSVLQEATIST
ncbi:MAG: hypothetical protein WAX89_07480, partial [Alphaproteobacteria bacterium]